MTGRLLLVATPLGNLGDLTARAAEILKSVEVVACEDTRRTQNLLRHLGASPRLLSVREANEERAAGAVIGNLRDGRDVAYCTDAGMPCVSDPGSRLVERVREAGFPVTVLPGPSAVTAALAVSGFGGDSFHFLGYLPPRSAARRRALIEAKNLTCSLVFFEAPHRVSEMLTDAREVLGDRRIAICRELTKVHEEILVATLGAIPDRAEWRGEFTVVVEGAVQEAAPPDPAEIDEWIADEAARDPSVRAKELSERAAARFDIPKRDAYALAVKALKK